MGHLVSPEAPAGLVRGVVDAAPGSPPPPVQRAVEMPMPARRGAWTVAVQRAYGAGLPSLTSAEPAAVSAAGLPVRQLVGEQPLVPPDEHIEVPLPRTGAVEPDPPARGAPPVQRTSDDAPPLPAPRRSGGLGAPLPGLPPTAQRRAVPPSPPAPPQVQGDSARPPDPVHAADPVPTPGETTTPDASTGTETVAPLLGDAPLKPEDGAPVPESAPDRRVPAAPVQRTTA
ncbi:hypothetical protein GT034_22085, partial [Streptomyces sp. SID2563]|nr:hypothetical protein [Streptomyces sp. SID2563]